MYISLKSQSKQTAIKEVRLMTAIHSISCSWIIRQPCPMTPILVSAFFIDISFAFTKFYHVL